MIKTIPWKNGEGTITAVFDGSGNGSITISSDANNLFESRSQIITVKTTDGSDIERTVSVSQAAKQRIDLSSAVVTAANQTYNGSAKTPTPTVTIDGSIVPSSGYDVSYSNNTNAGTADITITGKGDYTGTAYGTFTINKATPVYTAPTRRTGLTYNGSSQYLTTSGSTNHGTIYYSTNGSNWYTSRRTGTNAGTYYCYWKLVGDSNHSDVSSTYLGTTSIAKASRSIYWSSYPSSLKVGSSGSLSAYVSAGSGDGSISFSSSNSSKASVSGSTVTGVSTGTCTIYASVSEGTNYLSASTSYTITIESAETWYNNSFTWGKGGINTPGTSTGSTNPAMCMIGLPLAQASSNTTLKAANGYRILGVLTSDVATPEWDLQIWDYVEYSASNAPATVTIPAGKYYEISIYRTNGSNADTSVGYKSLLIKG